MDQLKCGYIILLGLLYHNLGLLKNINVLSHSSGGWKVKIKVYAGLVLSKGCEGQCVPCFSPSFWWFFGSLWHSLASRNFKLVSVFIFTWCSLVCVCVCVCVQISPLYKDISLIESGAYPIPA